MTLKCSMILGDCLEVMPTLPRQSVQMCFSDLPYGCTANRWDTSLPLGVFLENLNRLSPLSGGQARKIFTAVQPFASRLIMNWPKRFKHDLIFKKSQATGFLSAKRAPLRCHEHVLVFDTGVYTPQMTQATSLRHSVGKQADGKSTVSTYNTPRSAGRISFDRYPLSVVEIKSRENKLHPTQKPLALLNWIIRTYSNPGDHVLDPCSGSGTTAVSAISNGRHVTCIEKDQGYFDASCERVAKHIKDNAIDANLEVIR